MTHHTLTMMPESELATVIPDDEAGFGCLSTSRGRLPLEAMDVKGRIVGLVSELELRQTFINTIDEPIEATYIFPLPDRAAVTSFRMEVDGRIVDGLIKERGEARREYNDAIAAGHRAAITEEERSGVFTMRVGNLMPGEKAVVRLTMTGPLPVADGDVTFRFPLVVAPRYIPGVELAGGSVGDGVAPDTDQVPDASRISPPVLLPGYPNPVRLSLRMDIDAGGLPLSNLRSSLHTVVEKQNGESRCVALQAGERLDRDFILRYSVGSDAIESSLVLTADREGDEGTFMLTLVPPTNAAGETKPRDIMFVLDRSGSMSGWKMVAARRAVARMVDTLGNDDSFNVIAFDDSIESPPSFNASKLVAATDRNRFRAVEFLAKLNDRGGTEMARPLQLAADALSGGYADRERVLVLVTDGQVGNEDHILRNLKKRLKNVRIFTLGIDRAVNAGFLRRLATLGGGACELVESEDRLDEVMDKIHRRLATPVVTELQLAANELDIIADTIVPSRIPDLFANAPVTITGRYRGGAGGGIKVTGQDLIGGSWSQPVRTSEGQNRAVSQLWARGLIRQLEDQYVVGGHRDGLEKRIIATSLQYSVLCRFTAFVAVDREGKIEADGLPHQVTQPVEMPSGWAMNQACPAPAAAPGMMRTMMAGSMPMMGDADELDALAEAPAAAMPSVMAPMKKRGAVGALASGIAGGVGAVLGAPFAAAKAIAGRGGGGASDSRFEFEAEEADDHMDFNSYLDVEAEEAGDDMDFTSYLERLHELVDQLRQPHGDVDLEHRLKRVAAHLRQMVEDLESIDSTLDLVRALALVCTDLETTLRAGRVDTGKAAETTASALSDIIAEQGGTAPVRKAFWK